MYREAWTLTYLLNVIFQAFFTLISQILLSLLAAWLVVEKCSAPRWVYIPIILLGTFTGIFSMLRFLSYATKTLDKVEKEQKEKQKEQKENENKQ